MSVTCIVTSNKTIHSTEVHKNRLESSSVAELLFLLKTDKNGLTKPNLTRIVSICDRGNRADYFRLLSYGVLVNATQFV